MSAALFAGAIVALVLARAHGALLVAGGDGVEGGGGFAGIAARVRVFTDQASCATAMGLLLRIVSSRVEDIGLERPAHSRRVSRGAPGRGGPDRRSARLSD